MAMRISLRLSGAIIAVALLIVFVVALLPRPVLVEVATVTRGPLTATVTAEGRTRVKDLYVVAAPVDGELERIAHEPGDTVTPGTAVVRIWPMAPRPLDARSRAQAIAAVAVARATVTRAEASEKEAAAALTHAESQLATARTLSRRGRPRRKTTNTRSTRLRSAETQLMRVRPPCRRRARSWSVPRPS